MSQFTNRVRIGVGLLLLAVAIGMYGGKVTAPGSPPHLDPNAITAVVYVYEKDDSTPPPGVLSGLNRINREQHIPATDIDDDVKNGNGDVPEQYKIPIAAARAKSPPDKLEPALIVMRGAVPTVWHDVNTELDVLGAAK